MRDFFDGLMKMITLLTGVCMLGISAYLGCQPNSDKYGWFLLTGFAIIISTAIWCNNTEKK